MAVSTALLLGGALLAYLTIFNQGENYAIRKYPHHQ
jgi:hypothetical protein